MIILITLFNAIDELRRIAEEADEGFFSMDEIVDLTNDLEKVKDGPDLK